MNLRGYVNTTITPDDLSADFRCLNQVKAAEDPVFTRATFVIEDRVPTLNQTYDRPPALRELQRKSAEEITRETVEWETSRP